MENLKQIMHRPWIYLVIALIGISLKFYNVNHRYFWMDEIFTIRQTSGMNSSEANDQIPINQIKNISYYKQLLHLNQQDLTIGKQLKGQLKTMNLNPLHYTFLVFWHRLVGDDPVHFRYFSIFMFILTLPFLYLLAVKLFNSKLAGWIAISLFSVSPFYHYFAHEARYQMLCTFLIILCNYFFLEALNRKKMIWWMGYTIAGILGLYASILLGLVIIGHFLYLLIRNKKNLIPYLISATLIFLAYLPWLIFIINSGNRVVGSLAWHSLLASPENKTFFKLATGQLRIMAVTFVNLFSVFSNTDYYIHFNKSILQIMVNLITTGLIITSIVYTKRKGSSNVFYFLLFILLPSYLYFLSTDLYRGAVSSYFGRYHYISIIIVLLFMVSFLSRKITLKKYWFFVLYLAIATFGIVSTIKIAQSEDWNIHPVYNLKPIKYFEDFSDCLLITDFSMPMGHKLSEFQMYINELESNKIDILGVDVDFQNNIEKISGKEYSNIFIVFASENLVQNLKLQYGENMNLLDKSARIKIWELKN